MTKELYDAAGDMNVNNRITQNSDVPENPIVIRFILECTQGNNELGIHT